MAKDQPTNANLIHHYTHVVCALNETRKGSPDTKATEAVDNTIAGVCQLIDKLVSEEHRVPAGGVN